ncbi:hypothetical protein [Saccharopolyspora shandongensis]|uniref:hypothetical protein n=1 Tax=Saccharopolyspora shandongensis TaxID=418495 RepID=UPI0033E2B4B6
MTIPEHWQDATQRETPPTGENIEFQFGGTLLRIGRLEGGIHYHRHAASFELAVPRQLPTRPVATSELDLQARDELDAMAGEQERAIVALLRGPQRVANAVALDWTHANSGRYDHGQLYADLAGDAPEPEAPGEVLGGWLEALGLAPAQIPHEQGERASLFRSVTAGRRIAVLLANAFSAAQVRPLLPNSKDSVTLITSRGLLGGLLMDGARRIDVGDADSVGAAR